MAGYNIDEPQRIKSNNKFFRYLLLIYFSFRKFHAIE